MSVAVEKREELGNSAVGRLRKSGYIPGVIYGGKKLFNIKIEEKGFLKKTHGKIGDSVLVVLESSDKELDKKNVLLKEVQKNPLTDKFVHFDFQEVSMDKKIHTSIHISVVGDAVGVTKGGILEVHLREVMLECLPSDIPEKIEVDVTALEIGDSIYIRDLFVGEKVKIMATEDMNVLTISAPKMEEAPTEEGVAVEEEGKEGKEPEVISKGKKEEQE